MGVGDGGGKDNKGITLPAAAAAEGAPSVPPAARGVSPLRELQEKLALEDRYRKQNNNGDKAE